MHRSESIAQLSAALAAAQGAFPPIPRDRTVTVTPRRRDDGYQPPPYTFAYAPLDTILEKTRPALAANGLSISQGIAVGEDGVTQRLRTSLLHSSGEWLAYDSPLFVGKADNASQAYGSALTYARRYAVSALLCIATDDDDDGNGADDDGERGQRPQQHGRQRNGRTSHRPPRNAAERAVGERPAAVTAEGVAAMAAAGEGEPGIHGLSAGMEKVLMAKAAGVGMDRDALVRTFGSITPANINHVLGQLKPTGGA